MGVGRGMPREMRSSQRTSSFPLNGKQEEASTLVLSGFRKEVEFMGQVEGGVGIPRRRRQVISMGVPGRGMGSQTRSQQSWSQPCISKWNGLSISTTTYLTSSMVRLAHEEAVNIRARLLPRYRSAWEDIQGSFHRPSITGIILSQMKGNSHREADMFCLSLQKGTFELWTVTFLQVSSCAL